MALSVEKSSSGREYKVKDMSQADFGRLEIQLAEVEMPGLISCRTEFGPSQPFKGARITGSLHMTIQTDVVIETLTALGAEVRWCSCGSFSTQDHAAAAIACYNAAVFAWKGETPQEYWRCTERALDWGPGGGPDLIVDYGGVATLLIHEGVKAEEEFEKSGKVPDPASTDKMKDRLVGVSEETTTGVKRLYQMQARGALLFPAINVNDSVTRSKLTIQSDGRNYENQSNVANHGEQQTMEINRFSRILTLTASTSVHDILAFVIPTLFTFVQMIYPDENLFKTHPVAMNIVLYSLLAYSFAFGVRHRFLNRDNPYPWFHMAMLLFGSASLASLLSLVFPNYYSSWLPMLCVLGVLFLFGWLLLGLARNRWRQIQAQIGICSRLLRAIRRVSMPRPLLPL